MIFFTWGQSRTSRKLGLVADFCPVCRTLVPFQVLRMGVAGHFCGISLSKGRLTGHDGQCQQCGFTCELDATAYENFLKGKKSQVPITELVQQTYPGVRQVHALRLELEDRVRAGSLKPPEREWPMMEPFRLLSVETEAVFARKGLMGPRSAVCLGVAFAIVVLLLVAHYGLDAFRALPGVNPFLLAGGALLLGMLAAVGFALREPQRILERKILPMLARALRPLRPSREEVAYCLERYKQAKMKIGEKIAFERLWLEISRKPQPALKSVPAKDVASGKSSQSKQAESPSG